MTAPNPTGVTIPLSLGEIYDALCPDCQQAVVELVSAKAGPDFIRRAVAAQFQRPTSNVQPPISDHDPR